MYKNQEATTQNQQNNVQAQFNFQHSANSQSLQFQQLNSTQNQQFFSQAQNQQYFNQV
jgi:hypothetical protein